jgi:DNA-directed RNA polymerase specialized sigma24 family protein
MASNSGSDGRMSQYEDDESEFLAAFEAIGGQLTRAELTALLSSGTYRAALTQHVALLLDGDAAAAGAVVQASTAAVLRRGPLAQQEARLLLHREIATRTRAAARHRAPGAAAAAADGILALPVRQREAIVLRNHMRLSDEQAAAAMCISIGAMRSHLARAVSTLRRPPGQT